VELRTRGGKTLVSTFGRGVVLLIGEVLLSPLLVNLGSEEGCRRPIKMMPLTF